MPLTPGDYTRAGDYTRSTQALAGSAAIRARADRRRQQIADHRHRRGARRRAPTARFERDAADRDHRQPGARARGRRARPARGRRRRSRCPWSPCRTPGRSRCRSTGSRSAALDLRDACASSSRRSRRRRRCARAAAGGRSSWPTCTPAAPASRAMSARSLTMTARRERLRQLARSRRTARGTAAEASDLARSCSSVRAAVETRRARGRAAPSPRARGDVDVEDGVQSGTANRHGLRSGSRLAISDRSRPALRGRCFGLRAMKRSMNAVLSLPATKSGSVRILRCSGIVVLMPSMTVISSVRRMRAIASWRSRPWTMILAIIES